MTKHIALINGTLITPFQEIEQGCVLIQREIPTCKGGDESKFPVNRDRQWSVKVSTTSVKAWESIYLGKLYITITNFKWIIYILIL